MQRFSGFDAVTILARGMIDKCVTRRSRSADQLGQAALVQLGARIRC